jgi:hypothetical protein
MAKNPANIVAINVDIKIDLDLLYQKCNKIKTTSAANNAM